MNNRTTIELMAQPTFELTIQSTTSEGEFRLVAEWSQLLRLPVRAERTFTIEHDDLRAQVSSTAYGEALGRIIFVDRVRELFAQARNDDFGLRVLLAVEAKALQSLRWERLAAPFGDDWLLLGHNQRTPFSLYLPSSNDRRFPPFGRRDLRALVVVASPSTDNKYGVEPFDEASALSSVLEGLGDIPSTVLGKDPRAKGPPTTSEILRQLTTGHHTLMHLVSHGAYSVKTGETALFLDGDDGETEAVKATALIHKLKELGTTRGLPHLGFLAVCDSAKPEAESALGGLGQRLVRELGMPAVVAMTERVSQATALTLGKGFYARLREHGEVDRALVEACVDVRDRVDSVVPALFSRLARRPLFSDDLDRPLTHTELVATTEQLETLFTERAPVAIERVRSLGTSVAIDPETLIGEAKRDHQHQLAQLENLCESVLEISFSALARGREPPLYMVRCPFPGLQAFTAAQRDYFCGRDALVETLLQQLDQRPFLAVLGNSGCGKSSVVMAGVVPRLQDHDPTLRFVSIKPGDHPQARLAVAIEQLQDADESLLYVDQFEEAFTQCRSETERKEFFDRLLGWLSSHHRIIISMRADFIGDCAQHKGLRSRIEGLRLIPPMSADELRNAIHEQGNVAGLRYETGLCERILEDVENEPGAMPLLQHALQQLYERRHGRWLRIQAYEELGRVQRAITKTAEDVWDRLEGGERDRLRSIMLELTEVREAEVGGPARYLRRRVALHNLYLTRAATISPSGDLSASTEASAIQRLIDLLADERLLVKSHDDALGHVVEVAHEALLRGWERLQRWLSEARESIRLRQDLELATTRWRENECSEAYLEHVRERGDRVRSFLREGTLKLDPRLKEYFCACEAEEHRQREEKERQQQEKLEAAQQLAREQSRRLTQLRRSLVSIAMAGVAAVAAALVAFVLYGRAEQAKRDAEAAHEHAVEEEQKARDSEADAIASLKLAKARRAEVQADRPGERTQALAEAVDLYGAEPCPDQSIPMEVRRALFAVTRGLHISREVTHDPGGEPVIDIAFSEDSTYVATAGRDDTAKIWSVATGTLHATLEGHAGDVERVMFVPKSQSSNLLTVGNDGTAKLWSVDGKPLKFITPKGTIVAAGISSDGLRFATHDTAGVVTIWARESSSFERSTTFDDAARPETDLDSAPHLSYVPGDDRWLVTRQGTTRIVGEGRPLRLLEHTSKISAIAVSPRGRRVATGDEQGVIHLTSTRTGDVQIYERTGRITSIALSQRRMALAHERVIELWDTREERNIATLQGHRDQVNDIAFSPDGRLLATVGWDKTLRLWDAITGAQMGLLDGHTSGILKVEFSPDGKTIATAAENGIVRLWEAESETERTLIATEGPPPKYMELSPDGQRVAVATEEDTRLYTLHDEIDGDRGLLLNTDRLTKSMAWSSDGSVIVSMDQQAPRVFDAASREQLDLTPTETRSIASFVFSSTSSWLAIGDRSGGLEVFAMASKDARVEDGAHDYGIVALNFSADERRLATGSLDGSVKIWDVQGWGKPMTLLPHGPSILEVAFSPVDDQILVTGDIDGTVKIFNTQSTGHSELLGHRSSIRAIAFSPDGQYLITCGEDSTVRLWDVGAEGEVSVLGRHAGAVVSARFVDDGRRVVTASLDGVVKRWMVDPRTRLEFAIDALRSTCERPNSECPRSTPSKTTCTTSKPTSD